MTADLAVDYRRTNKFLRITLFLFGFLIINAARRIVALCRSARRIRRRADVRGGGASSSRSG
jgi:hypothetical protein